MKGEKNMTAERYRQNITEALNKIESPVFLNRILNYVMKYMVKC